MQTSKVLLFIAFLLSIVFAILCWTVPFYEIYQMPKNLVINTNAEEPLGKMVSAKYNEQNNSVDFMLLNALKLYSVDATPAKKVYIGGDTLGFEYSGEGVLVVSTKGLGDIDTALQVGDVIKEVNNISITSTKELKKVLNQNDLSSGAILKIKRNNEIIQRCVKPVYDNLTGQYKLGIWAKEKLNGVGTLTYIDPTTNRFGALGHPIIEPNTNTILEVSTGQVQRCVVLGVKKAGRGNPGEIKAVLSNRDSEIGSVDKNCEAGVFGNIDINKLNKDRLLVDLGGRLCASPGSATIYSAIDGKNIRPYQIEIIKTNYQSLGSQKNLVFKVTDKRLLEHTGGIVQGMSGSPIVQNGKLIGAVTHVFVNDPTKGFGIYIDNMINN